MTEQQKDPAILTDPIARAWRRGEITGGEVLTPQPMTSTPDTLVTVEQCADRFWANVARKGPDECWIWRKGQSTSYGYFAINGKSHRAHRVAWELENGKPFPNGLVARHSCDNPACVNPRHILPGTREQNNREAWERIRRTREHCPKGHPYDEANTILLKSGKRCRTCQRAAQRAYMKKRRAGGQNG